MKIGFIGTGNMARALGTSWALAGHEVFFGARRPEVAEEAAQTAEDAGAKTVSYGSNDQAATFGDVLFFSPRGVLPSQVLTDVASMNGKVLIDVNNQVIGDDFSFKPITRSMAEDNQADVPGAHVVKAFNTLAMEVFEHDAETLRAHGTSVFVAGDHKPATETVAQLARDLGFIPMMTGPLQNARLLETAGDLIRYFIIGAGLGPFATLNIDTLPAIESRKFGGRKASAMDKAQSERHVTVTVERDIDAETSTVWDLVRDFNNVPNWHPGVSDSHVENGSGEVVGAVRAIHLTDGTPLRERLTAISEVERSYSYSVIESPLPIENHRATVRLSDLGAGKTRVTWTTDFDAAGDADPQELKVGVVAGVVEPGIEGLATSAGQNHA